MDDQQEHVIDGRARARHWRGSKPKTGSAPDAAEARSDAPKSFAGVATRPSRHAAPGPPLPDEDLNGNEQGRAVAAAPPANAAAGRPGAGRKRGSPKPVPPPGSRPCRAPLDVHAPATARGVACEPTWVDRRSQPAIRPLRCLVEIPHWLGGLRLARLMVLAALTGAVVVVPVVATRPNAARPSFASALGATGPVATLGSGSLTAASNPFAQQVTAPR